MLYTSFQLDMGTQPIVRKSVINRRKKTMLITEQNVKTRNISCVVRGWCQLPNRVRRQDIGSICKECISIWRKKLDQKYDFQSVTPLRERPVYLFCEWELLQTAMFLLLAGGGSDSRHIDIQCHFFHCTCTKIQKEDTKGLHIFLSKQVTGS